MKKVLIAIGSFFALAILGQIFLVEAAAFPPALGGLGTTQVPASGTIPIGTGAGVYTPAFLIPGTDVVIANASGSVTISVQAAQFLPSSTVYVTTVNGQSGAVTITSSTLGVATNTISLFNGSGFTTTTIQSVLNSLSATGLLTYTSSTGAFGYTSSSLNLASAANRPLTDFLASSTVYVASVNGQSGAVIVGVPATTTINGTKSPTFQIIGDGIGVTSTVSGATTTFALITSGNWAGTWQGVNSTTFYLASNPSGYVSVSGFVNAATSTQANTFTVSTSSAKITITIPPAHDQYFAPSTTIPTNTNQLTNGSGFITAAPATTTLTAQGSTITGPAFTIATSGPLNAVSVSGQTVTITSLPTSTILQGYAQVSSTANITASSVTASFYATGEPVFDVKAFGAKVDGVTNDSAAVQTALNACSAAGGGIVQIPAGSIKLATTSASLIAVTPVSNCVVNGMGKGATTIEGGVHGGWTFSMTNSSTPLVGFGISNLTIDLQNVASSSAVQLDYASGTLINSVAFKNGPAAGWFLYFGVVNAASETVANYNNKIQDVDFINHAGTLETLLIFNAQNTQIVRPTFSNVSSPGIGLWQKDYDTHIEDPYCSNSSGKVIYYNITTERTNIDDEHAVNCGAGVDGAGISDYGTFNTTSSQSVIINNPILIGGSNSVTVAAIDMGATNNEVINNPIVTNYDIGVNIFGGDNNANTTPTNWSIIGGQLFNNNAENATPILHPGIGIGGGASGTFYGLITGVQLYDSNGTTTAGYEQEYPITFDGSGSATTFDYITFVNNRLQATNGGTAIRLQDGAGLGSNVRIYANQNYSGTNPPQTFDMSSSTVYFGNAINASGTITQNGVAVCLTTTCGGGTVSTSTSLTAGQIAFGTGDPTIGTNSNFTINTSTGVLAAPTGTFSGRLIVTGTSTVSQGADVTASPMLTFGTGNSNSQYAIGMAGGRAMIGYNSVSQDEVINAGSGKGVDIYTNATTNGTFLNGTNAIHVQGVAPNVGFVGINTSATVPYNWLDVNGSGDFRANLGVGTTTTSTAMLFVNGSTTIANNLNVSGTATFACFGFLPSGSSTLWYAAVNTSTISTPGYLFYATTTKPGGCQ